MTVRGKVLEVLFSTDIFKHVLISGEFGTIKLKTYDADFTYDKDTIYDFDLTFFTKERTIEDKNYVAQHVLLVSMNKVENE